MKRSVHFSSFRHDYETPSLLFRYWCDRLGLSPSIDVCATVANTKCVRFFTPKTNGLLQFWSGTCWMNPPYGREIGKWVAKASVAAFHQSATVVALLPARTDTKWWHDYVEPILLGTLPGQVHFLKGRVRFVGAKSSAPFPSVIVVFQPRPPLRLMAAVPKVAGCT